MVMVVPSLSSLSTTAYSSEVEGRDNTMRDYLNAHGAAFDQTQTWSAAQTFGAVVTVSSGGITVSSGGITVTGNSSITGTLDSLTGLTVASGGITVTAGGIDVTGNSSITGTLDSLTGLTVASGGITVTAGDVTLTSGDLTLTSGSLTLSDGQAALTRVDDGDSGTSKTLDFSTGNIHKLRLTGDCTLTLSNPTTGASYFIELLQDGTGSRTVTWPAAVLWESGSAPTLTTTAGRKDAFCLFYNGAKYLAIAYGFNFVDTT